MRLVNVRGHFLMRIGAIGHVSVVKEVLSKCSNLLGRRAVGPVVLGGITSVSVSKHYFRGLRNHDGLHRAAKYF